MGDSVRKELETMVRSSVDTLIDDLELEFGDLLRARQAGAIYAWLFEYMMSSLKTLLCENDEGHIDDLGLSIRFCIRDVEQLLGDMMEGTSNVEMIDVIRNFQEIVSYS